MPKQLTQLVLDEVSLVDEGANEDSRVTIVKRKTEPAADADPAAVAALDKPIKQKKKPAASGSAVVVGDPATTVPNAGATDGDGDTDGDAAVAKTRVAMLSFLPELAPLLVAKALAAGVAANPDAASTAASSIQDLFMDFATLSKALEDAASENTVLKARAETAEAALAEKDTEIAKFKGELETVTKSAAGAQTPEQQTEEFLKGLPEPVRKMFEAQALAAKAAEETVAKMRDENETKEAIAKAKSLGAAEPEKAGALMVRLAKGKTTAEDVTFVETLLKSTAAQLGAAGFYKSLGVTGGAAEAIDGEPADVLKAKADALQKADPKLSAAAAYAAAIDQNPHLYNAYIAKRRG